MKTRRTLIAAAVVVAVSALAFAARTGGIRRLDPAQWTRPMLQERLACMDGLLGPCGPQMMLRMLDLTDEQKEAIASLVENCREQLEQDIKAILTPEQLEQLEQMRDRACTRMCWTLNLTEEQQALIAEIRENARADAQAAQTPEAKRQIMQTARENIMAVLTDEQLEKLEQMRLRLRDGRTDPGYGRHRDGYNGIGRILVTLDLTEEQRLLIEEILEAAKVDMEAAREAVVEATEALHDAVAEGADEAAIAEAAAALADAITNQAILKANVVVSIKAVLTEEQLAELEEIRGWLG